MFGDDEGYWLLGDVFMRGWYNIHDHTTDGGRMGFVPFSGSSKTAPEEKTSDPTTSGPEAGGSNVDLNAYDIFTICLTIVTAILSVVAWCLVGPGGSLASKQQGSLSVVHNGRPTLLSPGAHIVDMETASEGASLQLVFLH